MLPLAITGISSLVQAGYGAYRGIKAQKGLDALAKQRKARFMDAAAPIQQNRQFGLQQMKQGLIRFSTPTCLPLTWRLYHCPDKELQGIHVAFCSVWTFTNRVLYGFSLVEFPTTRIQLTAR